MPTTIELRDDQAALVMDADGVVTFYVAANKKGSDYLDAHETLITAIGLRLKAEESFSIEQFKWFESRLQAAKKGVLAQLEEHPASNWEVEGSSPSDVANE